MRKSLKGMTLIELIIVITIIGILATFGMTQIFGPHKQALTQEALVNLKLIAAAEKIYRMEQGPFIDAPDTIEVNNRLRLSIPVSQPNWDYKVSGVSPTTFVGIAGLVRDNHATVWCIDQSTEEPYDNAPCQW